MKTKQIWIGLATLVVVHGVHAASQAESLVECAGIKDDPVRLACYDRLVKATLPKEVTVITDSAPTEKAALPYVIKTPLPPSPVSALSERWELDPESKAGIFQFRDHKGTYILPVYGTSNVNNAPNSPTHGVASIPDPQAGELKFQLSFKTKMMENLFDGRSDLWFGYTQQSHWQLYNSAASRPFRETNYEPEVILSTATDYDLFGWHGRLLNLGLEHQSNGRTDPLSRSWNRAYAQAGLEKGNWVLMVRPWWRIPEGDNDDNPDIERYMGHGDLVVMWKHNDQVVSILGRDNLDSGKGAMQLDWAFPLTRQLRGHVQLFSGYGESLIDYNHNQTTFGIGVSLGEGL